MDELNCAKCGRDYYPKQDWIHLPLCRYTEDVSPNHVPVSKREEPVSKTLAADNRREYMRDLMRQKRANEKAAAQP